MGRRRFHNADSKRYIDWIEASYTDLLCVQALMENEDLFEPCAFHCQQCAEKALKAYVLYQDHRLLDGHNLTWLCKQTIRINESFKEWLDESSALNRFYIETRYPTDVQDHIDKKTILKSYKMAKNLFHFVAKALKVHFINDPYL